MVRGGWWATLAVLALAGRAPAAADDAIPASLAPFEHLVGAWKGTGIPTTNRIKGWPERHLWAWAFADGKAVGLALTLEGDRVLKSGRLVFDEARKQYRLDGTDPEGKAVVFVGPLEKGGKALVLERSGAASDGSKERLTLRLVANMIRYTIQLDRREPGAPQYDRAIEIGMTKEGEAFAAGGSAADLPRCIITGGTATLTVSFQGKSFPVCCTGCRDEFNDNPEKYLKKALARAAAEAKGDARKSATTAIGKDDGSFAGLVDDEPDTASKPKAKAKSKVKPAADPDDEPAEAPADQAKAKPKADPAAKARALLSQAQALEKSRKVPAAVIYYRRIVKEYPRSAQARVAAARLKVLGGR